MDSTNWNPWHGCAKISPGCVNCYMFAMDEEYGKQSHILTKNKTFNAPVEKDRFGNYKVDDLQRVYTCITSDFFHDGADKWRSDAWSIIRTRVGIEFFIFTKRPERIHMCLPEDWKDGYANVFIGVSCENQEMLDKRCFDILAVPVKHRAVVCEPLLERLDLTQWLSTGKFEEVTVGGESARKPRICKWSWIVDIADQCSKYNVDFMFHQTGTLFEKDGRIYKMYKHTVQQEQALKAGLNTGRFI